MTIDEMISWLRVVAEMKRGDAEILIWSTHTGLYQSVDQCTFGADGTVYLQCAEIEPAAPTET